MPDGNESRAWERKGRMKVFEFYSGGDEPAEDVIEPDVPVIDAHHHLWPVESPISTYPIEDFRDEIAKGGHNVVATVFAECMASYRGEGDEARQPVGETDYVIASCPEPGGLAAGIVGFADLRQPKLAARTLDAHIEAGQGRFSGVRHNAVWDPAEEKFALGPRKFPRHLLLDAMFRQGLAEVARRGLTYDVWMFHHQLDDLAQTADAFPDLTIVLDHMGGPIAPEGKTERRGEVLAQWGPALREIARRPNVHLKIGGMGMAHFGFGFDRERPSGAELAALWRPYFDIAIDAFGPARCMAESNFPPDRNGYSYRTFWNAMKLLLRGYSPDERHDMFFGTASRVYRLGI